MNIYTKVLEIVANHVATHSMPLSLDGEKTLEALKIDSLDRVEISIALEEEFKIDLEADAVSAWTTVQDIINAVLNEMPVYKLDNVIGTVMHVDAIPNDAASVAELKLAVSQQYGTVGKPEAINRISRDDVEEFKHDGTLDVYQMIAVNSAIYPGKGTPFGVMYCALGLGEAGEIQNKVKKAFRDDNAVFEMDVLPSGDRITRFNSITPERRTQIIKEMGGNLWYLAALADELGITLSEVAAANLTELCDRGERNTLRGDGDNR